MAFPIDIINEKQNGWRQKLMVTPLTPASYYISKRSFGILILYAVGSLIAVYCIRHFKMAE
nr:hypothetical protein PEB16_06345 [Staphylococcus aureus]